MEKLSHEEMSRLYKENPEKFEAMRKELIEETIRNAPPYQQLKLRVLQAKWDGAMKRAGSPENRFAMAQGIFWANFFDSWKPTIDQLNSGSNEKEPTDK